MDTTPTTPTIPTSLDELTFRLHGSLHQPGDAYYADTCNLFNSMIDRRPRFVVECLVVDDVAAALAFAREHDLPVAVRAGGHSVAGLSLCDDGIVIDLRGIDSVGVDTQRRIARVGGGVTVAQLDRATQPHGLATTGGRVSTTGVAGLTMGGGSGWLERKHGLACDNLLAAEIVTWDSRVVRASAVENPELLWALRGGGGSFGVVTSLELALHPLAPEVYAGELLFDRSRAHDVLRVFRDTMNAAPEELSLACSLTTAPDDDAIPAALRGQPIVDVLGMWAGDPADGVQALSALRALGPDADFFGTTTYADFQCSVDDPPGYRNYWSAENVVDLPDQAIDAIVARAEELPPAPSQIFIVAWGGAVARAGAEHSPLAGRDARFIVHPLLMWEDPADDKNNRALARTIVADVREWSAGALYPNFLGIEDQARMRTAYGTSVERLTAVKAAWDPHDVFRTHHAIESSRHPDESNPGPHRATTPAQQRPVDR